MEELFSYNNLNTNTEAYRERNQNQVGITDSMGS